MPFAKRKYQGKLEKEFVIVHWDQRGAGKSFSSDISDKSMNINQFVTDTAELTKILLKRFNRRKLYLVGHSWGSVIGLLSAHKHPEFYFTYIGIGQVANMQEGEAISYKYVLEKARESRNKEAISELEQIGSPPYKDPFSDLGVQRKWLGEFGGVIFGESSPISLMAWEYFTFPEYGIYDLFYRFPRGFYFSLTSFMEEFIKLNLMNKVSEIKVPVYFVTGRHDYNVPFELTEKLFHHLKAPIKKLIWFEKSAHSPNFEEPDKFYNVMINSVLRETYEQ